MILWYTPMLKRKNKKQTSKKTQLRHYTIVRVLSYMYVLVVCSLIHAILIEPKDEIDQAMHLHDGKLPDLIVYEGEEPADVVLRWGKLSAKDHHPIVREPIYWDMLEKICWENAHLNLCTRQRAWEVMNMGQLAVNGQTHFIEFVNPRVDRTAKDLCKPITLDGDKNATTCLQKAAKDLCDRLYPNPNNCVGDMTIHMASQLEAFDEKRFDSKDTYVKLRLSMDAPDEELFYKLGGILRHRGMNLPPFSRVDNGTTTYYKWDEHFSEAFAAIDAFHKVKDPESREWNDKPCTPYFGGALCAKNDKDGNMMIEV